MKAEFHNPIYAGVLGKLLGVYRGRPVEGWSFEKINERFGEVYSYKNHLTGAPLIVPDDDISGTFAFCRALEDHGYKADLSAKEIGDTWLNYLVENQTILWWGGMGRSTEHTAYLRLKSGIDAPASGSVQLNGACIAEQVDSQIFIDAWALMNPGNPERAAKLARAAASVSHDGIAVECAVFLAAMEALAFVEKDIGVLLDRGQDYIQDNVSGRQLKELIKAVREQCNKAQDWHAVRDWIEAEHGYDRYPGSCPMVTNHLVVLLAFIMGGESFTESVMIATSAGWDTDCNAGNVGCLNGIRLGLEGLEADGNLRKPIADRMYVVTADGGSCVTDAVIETRKLIEAAYRLDGQCYEPPKAKYAFEFPGSVQGFVPYGQNTEEQTLVSLHNAMAQTGHPGLVLEYNGLSKGYHASACVDTFVDLKPKGVEGTSYYDVVASPSLYSGQEITVSVRCEQEENPNFQLFFDYFNEKDEIVSHPMSASALQKGSNCLRVVVPDFKGRPIYQLGIRLTSEKRMDGSIVIESIDWTNAPKRYHMGKSAEMTPGITPWDTTTSWLKTFVSSATHFRPDYTATFCLSHGGENGVATTGTLDWADYSVSSTITFYMQEGAGLVVRAKGHRQYYAAVLDGNTAKIILRRGKEVRVLAETAFAFPLDTTHELEFAAKGARLSLCVDGAEVLSCCDATYVRGGAGFLIHCGAVLIDGFTVKRRE